MENNVEYHLISEDRDHDFTNELNKKSEEGWTPIGNIAVGVASTQYSTTYLYTILLQKVKSK